MYADYNYQYDTQRDQEEFISFQTRNRIALKKAQISKMYREIKKEESITHCVCPEPKVNPQLDNAEVCLICNKIVKP